MTKTMHVLFLPHNLKILKQTKPALPVFFWELPSLLCLKYKSKNKAPGKLNRAPTKRQRNRFFDSDSIHRQVLSEWFMLMINFWPRRRALQLDFRIGQMHPWMKTRNNEGGRKVKKGGIKQTHFPPPSAAALKVHAVACFAHFAVLNSPR